MTVYTVKRTGSLVQINGRLNSPVDLDRSTRLLVELTLSEQKNYTVIYHIQIYIYNRLFGLILALQVSTRMIRPITRDKRFFSELDSYPSLVCEVLITKSVYRALFTRKLRRKLSNISPYGQ